MEKVFVTGIGLVTSIGHDKGTVVRNLQRMNHGIELYKPFDRKNCPVKLLGTLDGFDVESYDQEDWVFPSSLTLGRSFLRNLSPQALFAIFAMNSAIEDAKLHAEDISNPETGMYTASAGSFSMLYHNIDRMHQSGPSRANPKGVVSSIAGTLNFNLVSHFKIYGASCGFVSACASSGHALGHAFEEIRSGRQKRMFVVGGEDGNSDCILPFTGMRALTFNDDPNSASRPFDAKHDGFVGTGGSVVLVLETESEVKRREVTPYAEMRGWGQSSDGFNQVLPEPEGLGLSRAIESCLKSSGIEKDQVDYINAHAPSTALGDNAECAALHNVFANHTSPYISSTKALTGHGLSLASIMESAFTVLCIHEGFSPGSANITTLSQEAEGLNILRETLYNRPQIAISNSSGFGGANVVTAFARVKE